MQENIISVYNDLANQTWQRMVSLVGIHTVQILVQRSLWATRQKYQEAEEIEFSETGISFVGLSNADPQRVKIILEEFFGSLIEILTRLVGKEITSKLAREIDLKINGEGTE